MHDRAELSCSHELHGPGLHVTVLYRIKYVEIELTCYQSVWCEVFLSKTYQLKVTNELFYFAPLSVPRGRNRSDNFKPTCSCSPRVNHLNDCSLYYQREGASGVGSPGPVAENSKSNSTILSEKGSFLCFTDDHRNQGSILYHFGLQIGVLSGRAYLYSFTMGVPHPTAGPYTIRLLLNPQTLKI